MGQRSARVRRSTEKWLCGYDDQRDLPIERQDFDRQPDIIERPGTPTTRKKKPQRGTIIRRRSTGTMGGYVAIDGVVQTAPNKKRGQSSLTMERNGFQKERTMTSETDRLSLETDELLNLVDPDRGVSVRSERRKE